jgi:hypothetical protein
MQFKKWIESFGLITEAQTVSKYLNEKEAWDTAEEIEQIPQVRKFLIKAGERRPPPFKKGKTGLWISGQNTFPVRIVDAQKTNVVLEKQNGNDWSDILHRWPVFRDPETRQELILPKDKANIVNQKHYEMFKNWLTYIFVKSGEENPQSFFRGFFLEYGPKLDDWIEKEGMYQKFYFADTEIDDIGEITSTGDLAAAKANRSTHQGPKGKTFIEFPNGYKWLDLETCNSPEEGSAAGHCGSSAGNLYSLRDKDNKIHVTAAVENGKIVQMKAPGNKKPHSYTHPYILEFLKNSKIKGFKPGEYMPETDFQITDLSHKDAVALSKTNSKIISFSKIQEAAIQAKGDQRKFQELVKDKYNIQEFPYYYDYASQAVLVDQGSPKMIEEKYGLAKYKSNNYDSWKEDIKDSDFRPETKSPAYMVGQAIDLFRQYWDNLSKDTKQKVLKITGPIQSHYYNEGYAISEKLRELAKTDNNLYTNLQKIYSIAQNISFYKSLNDNLSSTQEDGYFLKAEPVSGGVELKVLLSAQEADKMLSNNKELEKPEDLVFHGLPHFYPGYYEEEGGDPNWSAAFYHAVEKTRIWDVFKYGEKGKTWDQEMKDYPGFEKAQSDFRQKQHDLAARGEHPMQILVRNQQIKKQLDDKMMRGGYEEYVKDLKEKGWWDSYLQWSKENDSNFLY